MQNEHVRPGWASLIADPIRSNSGKLDDDPYIIALNDFISSTMSSFGYLARRAPDCAAKTECIARVIAAFRGLEAAMIRGSNLDFSSFSDFCADLETRFEDLIEAVFSLRDLGAN